MKVPFDRDLITDQMNALGLSERTVISRTGISNFTFRQARQTGEFEGTITLRQLRTLAETLGLTLPQLFTLDDTPLEQPEQSARGDAAYLIAVLADVSKLVAVDHLARSLDWERPRLDSALHAIPPALVGTGLRLHTSGGAVKVMPARTDKKLKSALGRVRSLSLGLNTAEAAVLTRILNSENVLDRQPGNATRVAVGALKNMGCIQLNDHAVFEPTPDLRLALPDL